MAKSTFTDFMMQAEDSADNIFTQFMGGPSDQEVELEQAKAAAAIAKANAKASEKTIDAAASAELNKTRLYGFGILAVVFAAVVVFSVRK